MNKLFTGSGNLVRNWHSSIAVKITGTVVYTLVTIAFVVSVFSLRNMDKDLEDNYSAHADQFAYEIATAFSGTPAVATDDLEPKIREIFPLFDFSAVEITDGSKTVSIGERAENSEAITRTIPLVQQRENKMQRIIEMKAYFPPVHKTVIDRRNKLLIITAIAALLFGFFLTWVILRFIGTPIKVLVDATKAVAQGDLGLRLNTDRQDEFGDLSSFFNDMLDQITKNNAERNDSEKALRESEAQLRTIMDSINAGIVIIDCKTHEIVDANALALKLIGESKDRVVGNICHGYICPAEMGKCPITDLKQTIDLSERRLLNIKGDSIPIIKSVVPVQLKDRMVLVESFIDITALKKSEELIKNILEGVDEGFIIIDRDYRIILANRGFAEETKMPVEDIIGNYCYKISHQCDKPCYEVGEDCAPRHTFLTGEPYAAIHTHYTKDGNSFFIETKSYPIKDTSGEIVSVIETCNNITDKRKLEEQLRHVQKMEAVGTLAGGIAHDFNNILNVILGYSTMVRDTLEAGSPSREQMNEVLIAAERAENLTKRLLLFSRKEDAEFKPMNVNDIVINMEKMLSRIIGEDINLVTDLMGKKAMVMVDSGQMEQVLLNLATNARDAMPKGGSLTVRTELGKIDAEFIKSYDYGVPGKYTVISVTDTGVGIDKEKQARIFDPFFTTKEVGKGTGLGLSMAYGIIKQHNGYLNVYSETEKGTTFKIWLPVIKDTAENKPEVEGLSSQKGGTETLLVAEDDAPLRKLTKTVLEKAGYNVITAEDGDDAVTKFMENSESIQLIILDMIMPKKNGKEACGEIRKLSPGIKTLFFSGYTMDIIKTREIIESGFDFIHKPILPKDLLKKVREILDR